MEFCFWLDYLPTRHDWYGWVYMYLTCGLMTTTGWDGMGLHETRHYQQPTNQPTKETRCNNNNNNNILQIHFYDDTPLFLRKIMSFFLDGEKRERKRELYNVEKMKLEKPTQVFPNFHVYLK